MTIRSAWWYMKEMGLQRAKGHWDTTRLRTAPTRGAAEPGVNQSHPTGWNGLVCKDSHSFRPRQCNVLFLACSGQGCLTPPELWALGVGLPAQNLNSSQLVDRIIPTLTCWRSHRSKYCLGSDSLLESQKFVESCRDRGNTSPPPASVYSRVMTFMTASLHPEYLFYCPCRDIFLLAKIISWFQSY